MKKILIYGAALAGMAFLFFLLFSYALKIPDLQNQSEVRVIQSTKIYDKTGGILLYDVHGEERRTVIPFSEIPRQIKNATIAIEDDTFYQHFGFRPFSFLRAIFVNIMRGSFEQGGSTITQQLAKTTLLTSQKTVLRKIKEIVIAIKLEKKYAKDEILNLYLNRIPYGSNAYGVEAAAETFFGKHAKDLNVLESAYLASLPKAPSHYSPYGKYKKELDNRARFALQRMLDLGFIKNEEYESAVKEQIKFTPAKTQGIIAPHFVIEVREELNNMFGEDRIESGGFKVTTTLDTDLQQKTEEIINKFAPGIEKNFNAGNAAVVAIEPATGNIVAMVGSRDYFDVEHEGNFNVALAHRQPGSAFKPFVYATAFKKGFTPDTVVFDVPTEFNPLCSPDGKPAAGMDEDKCYHPRNFDEKFRGPVTLREALAQSLNVPSVKTLYLAGLMDSLATAKAFGITSLNEPDRYGLTLVLGGGEISPLELTSAYGVFANDGARNPYRYILKIEDADGKIIYETQNNPQEVIDKNIARAISDILSDNKARAPSFGEFSALYFPNKQIAAKTGTTNDYRDAWVIGYSPGIAIGAWAGNNNNAPMEKRVAGFIVAPFWHEIMDYALSRYPDTAFSKPTAFPEDKPYLRGEWKGGEEYIIDKISGGLATEYTPAETQEKKVIMAVRSILYWLGRQNDAQFKNWEDSVKKWATANNFFDQDGSVMPKYYDNIHAPANMPKITKAGVIPQKNAYNSSDIVTIRPTIDAKYAVTQVDYFSAGDENYLGSSKKYPFDFVLNLANVSGLSSEAKIKIRAYDSVYNRAEYILSIPVSNI